MSLLSRWLPARWLAAGAVAVAIGCWPAPAYASEFSGLGILVAAMFVGIPAALVLLGLTIASLVLLKTRPGSPGRGRVYSQVALIVSLLLIPAFPAAAIIFEGQRIRPDGWWFLLLVWAPQLLLAAGSIWAAVALLQSNRAAGQR